MNHFIHINWKQFNPIEFVKKISYLLCASILIFTVSCEEEQATNTRTAILELSPAAELDVKDVANAGDGSDFELTFTKPITLNNVEEFRIFILKSSDVADFDITSALDVPIENYSKFEATAQSSQLRFESDIKDIRGDVIEEGTNYNFLILTKGIDAALSNGILSTASNTIQLKQETAVGNLFNREDSENFDIQIEYLSIDNQGNLYATGGESQIIKIQPDGTMVKFAENLNDPAGSVFDDEGNLFTCNLESSSINKITSDGLISLFGNLDNSRDIAFDGTDTFYIIDSPCATFPGFNFPQPSSGSVRKMDIAGNISIFATLDLATDGCPIALDVSSNGNVYVGTYVETVGQFIIPKYRIIKIDPNGNQTVIVNNLPGVIGDIAINNDIIYYSVRGIDGSKVHRLDQAGNLTRLAGPGSQSERTNENGSASEASFRFPRGIAFDSNRNRLYVCDRFPSESVSTETAIRVIDLVE